MEESLTDVFKEVIVRKGEILLSSAPLVYIYSVRKNEETFPVKYRCVFPRGFVDLNSFRSNVNSSSNPSKAPWQKVSAKEVADEEREDT